MHGQAHRTDDEETGGLNQSFHTDQRMMGELESFASAVTKSLPYHREAVQRFLSKQPPLYDWDRMEREGK